jgi:Zn-dependent protease with chaperone function
VEVIQRTGVGNRSVMPRGLTRLICAVSVPSVQAATIPANRPSALYQLGLGMVTGAMVILPCIYVALTALAAYGVYHFATHYFASIWDWPIGMSKVAFLLKVICSVTPLLVGGAVAFFMVKPLFARAAARMHPLALNPEVEPRVYHLVHGVCNAVGAPAPRRIELNCDLNASAHFDRGLRGLLGNDLILTLGMPLIAGLSEREVAGVIAHEFGHFRQGAGMRLSYLIRRVNGWFARVIYERDGWDETIETWAEADEWWIAFMVGCARFGVWVSRSVLRILMLAGHGISAFLLREMEYDADKIEALVAGSAAFERTMLKLATLSAVLDEIHHEMRRVWRTHLQLPDNLPVLVEYRAARLPEEQREKVENSVGLTRTGIFDTHPSTADRVRRARRLAEAGLEISDEPARRLFENFESISRLVTLAHYEDDLNVPTTGDFLIPLEQLIGAKTEPAPAVAPAPSVPLMSFDPQAFRRKEPPSD